MSRTETFSNSIDLPVINEYDKDAVMEISTVVQHDYHVLVERSSETRLFRLLSDFAFGGRNFGNTKSMRVIFFTKYLKFKLGVKNAPRNLENIFCF